MLSNIIKRIRKIINRKALKRTFFPVKVIKDQHNKQHTPSSYRNVEGAAIAYRQNEEAILKGNVPEKYHRIIPSIDGNRILEIGSAEGVLSLLLSKKKEMVYALEISTKRHEIALNLQKIWSEQGHDVSRCKMILGNITDNMNLLKEVDTVVAVRVIYHFKEELDVNWVFEEVGKHVKNVVLVGHEKKSKQFWQLSKDLSTSPIPYYYYATIEGMSHLLEKNGYKIDNVISDGDPIVVGKKVF